MNFYLSRFYAIYYPLNKKCSSLMCWITIVLIWLFSLVISFPWLVYFDLITVNVNDYSTSDNGDTSHDTVTTTTPIKLSNITSIQNFTEGSPTNVAGLENLGKNGIDLISTVFHSLHNNHHHHNTFHSDLSSSSTNIASPLIPLLPSSASPQTVIQVSFHLFN